jgi:hypothetical protein
VLNAHVHACPCRHHSVLHVPCRCCPAVRTACELSRLCTPRPCCRVTPPRLNTWLPAIPSLLSCIGALCHQHHQRHHLWTMPVPQSHGLPVGGRRGGATQPTSGGSTMPADASMRQPLPMQQQSAMPTCRSVQHAGHTTLLPRVRLPPAQRPWDQIVLCNHDQHRSLVLIHTARDPCCRCSPA